ncbi:MAG: translation initiation factor IF-3, partial [Gammaproteobacteria bacterium]
MAAEKKNRVNSQITSPKVRLIGEDGKQIGVVAIDEAQRTAEVNDLDLVEISPAADPPVCRVMDYGKFLYELNRKRQAAKKKQKQIQVKEIKIR